MSLRLSLRVVFLPVLASFALSPSGARASCSTDPVWSYAQPVTRPASSRTLGLSYIAYGTTLQALWSETVSTPTPHTGGTVKWAWSPSTGGTLSNFAEPVPLASNPSSEFIFLGSTDGRLYKIDASTGANVATADTRRSTCTSDQVIATPAVQLYQYSSREFQLYVTGAKGATDDIVYVITRHQCGDAMANQVRAYWASDLTLAWTFNNPATYQMDYGAEGCAVDYLTSRIYCGTAEDIAGQPTLWALNAMGGAHIWSTNAGPVLNRPMINTSSSALFVGSLTALQKRSPSSGALTWTYPLGSGAQMLRNVWPEFRPPANDRIYFVDTSGRLHGVEDAGSVPVDVFPPVLPGGMSFTSVPVVLSGTPSKVYVGRSDGRLQQVDASTGALDVDVDAGLAGTLLDPALDGSMVTGALDRLVVPSIGAAKRFCVPFDVVVGVGGGSGDGTTRTLWQSAPNPFARETRIEYLLARAGRVELAIYGAGGERVRTLVNEERPAGMQTVGWDGLDDRGVPVSSGTYFYRLRTITAEGVAEASEKIQIVR